MRRARWSRARISMIKQRVAAPRLRTFAPRCLLNAMVVGDNDKVPGLRALSDERLDHVVCEVTAARIANLDTQEFLGWRRRAAIAAGIKDDGYVVVTLAQRGAHLFQQPTACAVERLVAALAIEQAEMEEQVVAVHEVRDNHRRTRAGKKREAWRDADASSLLGTAEGTGRLWGLRNII